MKKHVLLFFSFLLLSFVASAQEKCVTHIKEEEMRKKYPQLGTKQNFETWMAHKTAERQANLTQRAAPYKVPIIIHVIHAGEAVGNNSVNIPYGQAMSQIRVLNQDFQKTNPDFAANVLAVFQAQAGSLDLTFEPATKDPNGVPLAEVGVNRINGATASWGGGRTSWSTDDCDDILKPNTVWDPTRYCNIWVVRFAGGDDMGLFGYAQFPEGSTLPGVPTGGTALTDGVVINWRGFGSNYDAAGVALSTPYVSAANLICSNCDKGRTLTHEIGHWLGLRHIWGDGEAGCANANNNDYCQDTPFTTSANNPTSGCPTRPNKCSTLEPSYGNTNTPDQRENYMDYSSDGCMGMFSINQLQRVETVLLNSPRRVELLTSTAAAPIDPNAITANFNTSTTSTCAGQSVTFTNTSTAGSSAAAINSWTWNFDVTGIGGASPATFTGQNPPAVTFATSGSYQVRLTIGNGTTTDDETKTITILGGNVLPITAGFEGSAPGWTVGNSGGSANWSITNTAGQTGTGSAWVNLYNTNISTNSLYLYPPIANLQGYTSASFQFYVAYTTYNADYATLSLEASTNCGSSYSTVWTKTGTALSTTTPTSTTSNWTPTAAQWRVENVDVSSLIGNGSVLFRFKLTDNFSNNIYIDNVNISGVASAPPTTPSGLTATAISSSQINLSWTDNASNETAYKVERSPDGTTGWTEIVGNLPAGTTSYSNTGLSASTTYHYRVRASNAGGNSGYSNVANATTLAPAPTDPSGLTATAVSQTQINLSWTDNANNETGYKVERSPDGTTGWTEIAGSLPAGTTSYSNTGLTAATTYYYRVRAYNAGGNSGYSNVANATTLPNPPADPSGLTATAVSSSQINLSWTDNANNETGYKVERSPDGTTGWTEIAGSLAANSTSYSDNGLTSNTTYHYRVRASNTGGNSGYSNVANATTFIVINAPSGLTATAVSTSQINLSWTDNANNETSYKVERSPDGTTGWTEIAGSLAADATSYSDNGLAEGTTYHYRVRASVGTSHSAYSNVANATTLVNAPNAPTTLTATAISASQINLSWADNSTTETAYKVERSADGTNFIEIVGNLPANTTSYSDNGLTAATTYHYRVRAANATGNSGYSNVANATTLQALPTAPTTLTATAASTSQINLSWTDNASNEIGYKVERSTDGTNFTEIAGSLAANATTYADNGLTANTTYHYRVRAFNAGGNSGYSNTANAKTQEEAATAIGDELDKAIIVYPNPSQGKFTVDLTKLNAQNIQLDLYNMLGSKIQSKTATSTLVNFELDKLPKGVYFLQINTSQGKSLKKIVID